MLILNNFTRFNKSQVWSFPVSEVVDQCNSSLKQCINNFIHGYVYILFMSFLIGPLDVLFFFLAKLVYLKYESLMESSFEFKDRGLTRSLQKSY